jgi:hypothetical protein
MRSNAGMAKHTKGSRLAHRAILRPLLALLVGGWLLLYKHTLKFVVFDFERLHTAINFLTM